MVPDTELMVVCLCADWCGVCREYRPRFEQVQKHWPGVRFRWIDIEDACDLVDPVEVDDFPTVMVLRGPAPVFFGTVRPQTEALARLLGDRLSGGAAPGPFRPEVLELAQRLATMAGESDAQPAK